MAKGIATSGATKSSGRRTREARCDGVSTGEAGSGSAISVASTSKGSRAGPYAGREGDGPRRRRNTLGTCTARCSAGALSRNPLLARHD